MLSTASVRTLVSRDVPQALAILDADPVPNVFVASRVHAAGDGGGPLRLSGELWGYWEADQLISLCYAGANLVPVAATPAAVEAFAERARARGRRCSAIVGPAEAVEGLWSGLRESWGRAREERMNQPLLSIDGPPLVEPDRLVRTARRRDIDALLPASIAMFTEEVGVSPVGDDGGALYRSGLTDLVVAGRSFVRIEDDRVVFKAEAGAVTPYACQVTGVWVHPALRGRGLSVGGMAAVVALARRHLAPVVSLYVNHYNAPALAAYRRVGFREVGRFASVLF